MLLRTIMLTTRSFLDERKTWQKKKKFNMHMLSIVLLFIPAGTIMIGGKVFLVMIWMESIVKE